MNNTNKGFIPVMLTPFDEAGKIDYPALDRLIDYYLDAGAAGLFANCLSSEMFELSPDERIALTKYVVDAVKGAVPVVATGTFGGPVEEQAKFVQQIYATGVKAVIVITGLLADEADSDEIFDQNINQLLALTGDTPIGFYECPVPYKRLISPEQLGRFVATGRVTYHKDTSLDIEQIRAKIAACKVKGFGLYDAYLAHAVETLKAGAAGLSCIQGNYFPELIVWLCDNYNNTGRAVDVAAVQQFLIDNMDVMHDVYPITAKHFLQLRGVRIGAFTRRDVGVYTARQDAGMKQLLSDYNTLAAKLNIPSAVTAS